MIKVNFKGKYLLISGVAWKLSMQYPWKAVRTVCLNPIKLWKKWRWNTFLQNSSNDIRNISVLPEGFVEEWALLYGVVFNLSNRQSRLWPWLAALCDSSRLKYYACICNHGMPGLRLLRNYQKMWLYQKFTDHRDWFFTFVCDSCESNKCWTCPAAAE